MDENALWLRGCYNKKTYTTVEKVQHAIEKNTVKFNKQYSYYKCPDCENYHTTTQCVKQEA